MRAARRHFYSGECSSIAKLLRNRSPASEAKRFDREARSEIVVAECFRHATALATKSLRQRTSCTMARTSSSMPSPPMQIAIEETAMRRCPHPSPNIRAVGNARIIRVASAAA